MDSWDGEAWVEARLASDDTLVTLGVAARVFRYLAPPAVAMPFIVLAMQPNGTDTKGVGIARILSDLRFTVRVTGSINDEDALIAIAKRFDPALEVRESNGVGCVRVQPLSYVTQESGQVLRHFGGIYRVVGA